MILPSSCRALPPDVQSSLRSLIERVEAVAWLDGPGDREQTRRALFDYFDRLPAATSDTSGDSGQLISPDTPHESILTYDVKWITHDWEEAFGWTSHCYMRGNITALSSALDLMDHAAARSGRSQARHDAWDHVANIAKKRAQDPIKDGAWFTAGAAAAWVTVEDVLVRPNPFASLLGVWEQGNWPIGHIHSYQHSFVVFEPRLAPVEVFISYKWEDARHNEWVDHFYRCLRARGVDAKLDRYEVPPGGSFTQYMGQTLERCQRVLFVITPASVHAANEGTGGLGFEVQLANAIRIATGRGAFIIPILREGDKVPTVLRDNRWLDFRDDKEFSKRMNELLGWLSGYVRPPRLGTRVRRRFRRG